MSYKKTTDEEILAQEINAVEEVLAGEYRKTGRVVLINPDLSLADRVCFALTAKALDTRRYTMRELDVR